MWRCNVKGLRNISAKFATLQQSLYDVFVKTTLVWRPYSSSSLLQYRVRSLSRHFPCIISIGLKSILRRLNEKTSRRKGLYSFAAFFSPRYVWGEKRRGKGNFISPTDLSIFEAGYSAEDCFSLSSLASVNQIWKLCDNFRQPVNSSDFML